MKRVICLVLTVVLMLSMACTAFAATSSGGHEPGTGGGCIGGADHNWKDGVCEECGEECEHEKHNKDGECTECGEEVEHTYKDGKCTICGKKKSSGSSSSGSNPKTGDMMILPYAAAMVSSAAAVAYVYRKKNG